MSSSSAAASASATQDIQDFFDDLETNLESEIEPHYFDLPRRFRYAISSIGKMVILCNTAISCLEIVYED